MFTSNILDDILCRTHFWTHQPKMPQDLRHWNHHETTAVNLFIHVLLYNYVSVSDYMARNYRMICVLRCRTGSSLQGQRRAVKIRLLAFKSTSSAILDSCRYTSPLGDRISHLIHYRSLLSKATQQFIGAILKKLLIYWSCYQFECLWQKSKWIAWAAEWCELAVKQSHCKIWVSHGHCSWRFKSSLTW